MFYNKCLLILWLPVEMTDSVIEEHFRRSLGNGYASNIQPTVRRPSPPAPATVPSTTPLRNLPGNVPTSGSQTEAVTPNVSVSGKADFKIYNF